MGTADRPPDNARLGQRENRETTDGGLHANGLISASASEANRRTVQRRPFLTKRPVHVLYIRLRFQDQSSHRYSGGRRFFEGSAGRLALFLLATRLSRPNGCFQLHPRDFIPTVTGTQSHATQAHAPFL